MEIKIRAFERIFPEQVDLVRLLEEAPTILHLDPNKASPSPASSLLARAHTPTGRTRGLVVREWERVRACV